MQKEIHVINILLSQDSTIKEIRSILLEKYNEKITEKCLYQLIQRLIDAGFEIKKEKKSVSTKAGGKFSLISIPFLIPESKLKKYFKPVSLFVIES
jgi:hypothetical protein